MPTAPTKSHGSTLRTPQRSDTHATATIHAITLNSTLAGSPCLCDSAGTPTRSWNVPYSDRRELGNHSGLGNQVTLLSHRSPGDGTVKSRTFTRNVGTTKWYCARSNSATIFLTGQRQRWDGPLRRTHKEANEETPVGDGGYLVEPRGFESLTF